MDNGHKIKKRQLMQEYFNRFRNILLILECVGFCRFTVRKGKITKKTFRSLVYNVCVLIVSNVGASYLLYIAIVKKQYLSLPETITIMHFTVFANLMLINITFSDKGRGYELLQNCIDIDTFFGPDETKFMRDIAMNLYVITFVLVGIAQATVVTYMYVVFEVSIAIHIVGSLYIGWMFFAYDDFCFYMHNCLFITLRARYLNVALMKITEMNPEYIPKQLIFFSLFWKEKYDEKISFHNSNAGDEFIAAFKMLYKQLRGIENCYRCMIILGVLTVVMGSFVSVEALAMYLESPGLVLRSGAILFGIVVSWFLILMWTLQIDMFYGQIEQTRLICAYTQLKPTNSDEIFKITKRILQTLEVREARASLYDMFFFNTRLTLNIAASTLVYITVQLQVAFPSAQDAQKYNNNTIPLDPHDANVFKRFLI